ncbi:hypothetical protein K0J45_06945 [Shewanella alkalitolerans]|uniref:formyltransferase family protein n=1 Tax=Shewanella alkalitolerans TaxID=2864209 RepID=UPI001C65D0E7|nr:formyltransferase family protein [Shewanella alkalitolerans]QYJ98956.1 hypothetical protein K0J45_06945 [Shewanella alkalitolerans]
MSKLKFETVIIIGFGKIAQDVASILVQYGVTLKILQTELPPFSTLESFAKKEKIIYAFKKTKKEIESTLFDWLSGNTLVISANNNYLFKDNLISRDDVKIINFHNALLPNLRGRNAPSWAIHHQLCETGVTWHYVDEGVDTGAAIAFDKVKIGDHDRAYQVAHKCMQAGLDAFSNFITELLEKGSVPCQEKYPLEHDYLYLSRDIPNGGILRESHSIHENYRILKALDYGPFDVFPKAEITYKGMRYLILSFLYIKLPTSELLESSENCVVLQDDFSALKLKVKIK